VQAEGEFALVKDKLESALELSGQPVKRGTMAHEHIVYMMLVDAAARAGDETAIQKYAPKLEELAARDKHIPYLAVAHRAWGIAHRLAGEYAEAEKSTQAALGIFEDLGMPWQTGRTWLEKGQLAMAKSENEAAREHFSRAQQLFEALGAGPDADRTAVELDKISETA
jgi:tetratricopeptide (TPR) repeat protein